MVVDASIAVRWYAVDAWTGPARALFGLGQDLMAPDLIIPEVTNALWKLARAGTITDKQADDALEELTAVVLLVPSAPFARRAFTIARNLDHPAYDCFYLALAEQRGEPVVTLDQRLYRRTRGTAWDSLTRLLDSAQST